MKNDKLATLKYEFREAIQHIHETISLSTGFLNVIQSHAENFSTHRSHTDLTTYKYLNPSDAFDGYSLDNYPFLEDLSMFGNLTGHGDVFNLNNQTKQDISLAFSFTPLFKLTREYVPNAKWFYYISRHEFIYLYPFLSDSEYTYVSAIKDHQIVQMGLPENNVNHSYYWTNIYIDRAANVMMVTVGIPIYQDNEFTGVVALDLTLNSLNDYLTSIISKNSLVFLADESGSVIANPEVDFDDIQTVIHADSLLSAYDLRFLDLKSENSDDFKKRKGNQVLAVHVNDTPWVLYVIKSDKALFIESILDLLPQMIIALLTLVMLVMIFRLVIAKKQIRASEMKFHRIFNELKQMMFVLSPNTNIIESNSVSFDLIGIEEMSLKSLEFAEVPLWQNTPGLKDKFVSAISECKTGHHVHFETVLNSVRNEERTIDFTFFPIHDNLGKVVLMVVSGYDISDLKEIQRRLHHTIEELEQTQDQLIVSEKKAAFVQLAASLAHELNNPIAVIKASFSNYQEAAASSILNVCVAKTVLTPSQIYFAIGIVENYLNSTQDLSSRERRQLKKDLERNLQSQTTMDATVLADVLVNLKINSREQISQIIENDNLPVILGLARSLSSLSKNEESIGYSIKRALNVVSSFKEYAGKEMKAPKELLLPNEAVDIVLHMLKPMVLPGINFIKNVDEDITITISKDDLYQVLTHLIKNAIQACKAGDEISIQINIEEDLMVVKISDTGCGIPIENYEKIFEPFFTTKTQGQGAGLGLYIVNDIINSNKGSILFTSVLGKGTDFIVKLPL
ncbi:MAG: GHKL domain-containing protein [Bacteroidales bacterium]|nr:GHKL domain-containing protein [Bacteroidales bacterium]